MRVAFKDERYEHENIIKPQFACTPIFTAQVNAEPVALAAQTQPAATAVKTIVPITAKPKNKLWHKLKSLQIQQMLIWQSSVSIYSVLRVIQNK